jgi:hypothetical protein
MERRRKKRKRISVFKKSDKAKTRREGCLQPTVTVESPPFRHIHSQEKQTYHTDRSSNC